MAKDLEAQERIRNSTIERKLDEVVRRKFYQRTCRRAFAGDGKVQHDPEYYGQGLRSGVFNVPIGESAVYHPKYGAVCPVCAEELTPGPVPKVVKVSRKVK